MEAKDSINDYLNGYIVVTIRKNDKGELDNIYVSPMYQTKLQARKYVKDLAKEYNDGITQLKSDIMRSRFYPKGAKS